MSEEKLLDLLHLRRELRDLYHRVEPTLRTDPELRREYDLLLIKNARQISSIRRDLGLPDRDDDDRKISTF